MQRKLAVKKIRELTLVSSLIFLWFFFVLFYVFFLFYLLYVYDSVNPIFRMTVTTLTTLFMPTITVRSFSVQQSYFGFLGHGVFCLG